MNDDEQRLARFRTAWKAPPSPFQSDLTSDWRRWALAVLSVVATVGVVYAVLGYAGTVENAYLRFSIFVLFPLALGTVVGRVTKPLTRISKAERAKRDAEFEAWQKEARASLDALFPPDAKH